jgi:hypothetical protein
MLKAAGLVEDRIEHLGAHAATMSQQQVSLLFMWFCRACGALLFFLSKSSSLESTFALFNLRRWVNTTGFAFRLILQRCQKFSPSLILGVE